MQTIYFRINEEAEKQKQCLKEQLQRKLLEADYNNLFYHSTVDMGHILTQPLCPVCIPLTYRPRLSQDMQEHIETDRESIFCSFVSEVMMTMILESYKTKILKILELDQLVFLRP